MELQLVAAIDGGGTKTVFAIADTTGRIRGVGCGGPVNAIFVAQQNAVASVRAAAASALADMAQREGVEGGLYMGALHAQGEFPVAALYASAPGASPEIIAEGIRGLVSPAAALVEGDGPAVFAGAHAGGDGVVVLAGTGSFAFGRASDGHSASTGGWGPLLGDEGSAYDIGLRALRSAVRAVDGRGPSTGLTAMVLEHFRITRLRELARMALGREIVAAFAVCVSRAAAGGDGVARAILEQAGRELGMLGARVAEELLPHHCGQLAVALTGGAAAAGGTLAEGFEEVIAEQPGCRAAAPALSPIAGALMLALGMADVVVNDRVIANIRQVDADPPVDWPSGP